LICRLAGRHDGRKYLLNAVASPPRKIAPLPSEKKFWPAQDLVTVLLQEVCASNDIDDDPGAVAAYAALALQRLSVENLAARKLVYVGALPAILVVLKAIVGTQTDEDEDAPPQDQQKRALLVAAFLSATVLNACAGVAY